MSLQLQTVCAPPRTVLGVYNIATNSVHLSVCPFVTRQDCVQTAKHIVEFIGPPVGSSATVWTGHCYSGRLTENQLLPF